MLNGNKTSEDKREETFRVNNVIVIIFLISFFYSLSHGMLNLTMPMFARQLGAAAQAVGLLTGIFSASALLMRPFAGQIVDNENRVIMLRICLSVVVAAIFGLTQATRYWMLLAFFGLNGFAWGVGSTLCTTIAVNCFTVKNMATGIGFYGLGSIIAQSIAPLIALPVAEKYGYNALYFVNFSLILCCLAMSFILKPTGKPKETRKYSLNIKNIVYFPAIMPALLTLCSAIAKSSILAFLLIFAGTMSIKNIGLYFTIQSMMLFVFRPIMGRLADRIGTLKMLIFCESMTVTALVIISQAQSLPYFLAAAVLMGLSSSGEQPILLSEAVRNVDPSRRGSANNTNLIGADVGFFAGSNIAGFLATYLGFRAMYLLIVLPLVICTIFYAYFTLKKRGKKQAADQDNP